MPKYLKYARDYLLKWRKTPQGQRCKMADNARRRALHFHRPGQFTEQELAKRIQTFGWKSWLTGKSLQGYRGYSLDHIVPLAHGKSTNYIWNVAPLTWGENASKKTKDVYIWLAQKIQAGNKIPSSKILQRIAYAYRRQLGVRTLRKGQEILATAIQKVCSDLR